MDTPSGDIYSDQASERVFRRRRADLIGLHGLTVAILTSYNLLFVNLIFAWPEYSAEELALNVGMWLVGTVSIVWGLDYAFIRDRRARLKHGITLTREALVVYGVEIPVSDIVGAEVVEERVPSLFPSERSNFALRIHHERSIGGRRETALLTIRDNETENLLELRDRLREVIKMGPETE
jgi:hypothetical protein